MAWFESKEIVESYKSYRPHYSQQVADHVIDELKRASPSTITFDLIVDVGCGSGQATNLFAPYFNKALATDISQEQIKSARKQNKFKHVGYEMGKAEEINAENGSVDLLLAAAAAHWFDLEKFLLEASRVLKPQGCLALIGYGSPQLIPNVEKQKDDCSRYASNLFHEIVLDLGKELKPEKNGINSKYSGICDKIQTSAVFQYTKSMNGI